MNQGPVDDLKQQIHTMVQSYLVEWVSNLVLEIDTHLPDGDVKQQLFSIVERQIPNPASLHNELDKHSLQTSILPLNKVPVRYLKCHGNTSHITHSAKLAQQMTHEINHGIIPKKVRSKYKSTPLLTLATELSSESSKLPKNLENNVASASTTNSKHGKLSKPPQTCAIVTSDDENESVVPESWAISNESLREIVVDIEGNIVTEDTDIVGDIQSYLWDVETNCVFQETGDTGGEYVGNYCLDSQRVMWYNGEV